MQQALKVAKKVDLASLKSNLNKLNIDKLKNVPINLNILKNKIDKLDVVKLVPVPVELSKLSDLVKDYVVRKMYLMLKSKIWKIKYLILLT